MEPTHSRNEIAEICDRFEAARQRELELAQQEQDLIHRLAQARLSEVQSANQLRNGDESPSQDPDELLRTYSNRRRDLVDQQAKVAMLTATLDRTRNSKKQAACEVAEHYRLLAKQAHDALKERYGRSPARFSLWSPANEAEMAWRTVMLNQLLYLVQTRVPDSLAALRLLLTGEPFRLRVVRGFFVRVDSAMKQIGPTIEGAAVHVPKDIPARDAFETMLVGRVELAPWAS